MERNFQFQPFGFPHLPFIPINMWSDFNGFNKEAFIQLSNRGLTPNHMLAGFHIPVGLPNNAYQLSPTNTLPYLRSAIHSPPKLETSEILDTVTPPLTPLMSAPPISTSPETTSTQSNQNTLDPKQPQTKNSGRLKRGPVFVEGETSCPLCGLKLRSENLAEHYQHEISQMNNTEDSRSGNGTVEKKRESRSSRRHDPITVNDSRRNVLMRVRHNRKLRSKSLTELDASSIPDHTAAESKNTDNQTLTNTASTSSSPASQPQTSNACPVCFKNMNLGPEAMTLHVEACLRKQSGDNDCNSQGGSEQTGSGDEFETYTWCGQTRVRATTMLGSDALNNSGFYRIKSDEQNDDVIIDDDDLQYGDSQFTEADVIPVHDEDHSIRQALINSSKKSHSTEDHNSKWSDTPGGPTPSDQPEYKCLICMDQYTEPLASIECWHVYCRECWLRTLGAKKLCPQCNTITSPRDLRRIYL